LVASVNNKRELKFWTYIYTYTGISYKFSTTIHKNDRCPLRSTWYLSKICFSHVKKYISILYVDCKKFMSYIYCAEVGTVGGWVSTFPWTRPVMGKFQKMVSSPFKKKKKILFRAGIEFSRRCRNWLFSYRLGRCGIYLETNPNPIKSRDKLRKI